MAIHSSILAWRIPRTEKPGGLYAVTKTRAHFRLTLSFPLTLSFRLALPN